MNRKGFSLIEMVIVISIMTILVGAAMPMVSSEVRKQKVKDEIDRLNAVKTATESYFTDTGVFPDEIGDLVTNDDGVAGWLGPYYNPPVSRSTAGGSGYELDSWNTAYRLTQAGVSTLTVESAGSDRAFNSNDDLSVSVDTTYIRRTITLEELDVINGAILAYNKVYIGTAPLLPSWSSIRSQLVSAGYLPAGDTRYDTDGWGFAYTPDPPGAAPVVRVNSTTLMGSP